MTKRRDDQIHDSFGGSGSIFSTARVMTSCWATVVFLCSPTVTRGVDPARSWRARAPAVTTNSNELGSLERSIIGIPYILLDILDLFTHLLEFGLRRDDELGYPQPVGLRAHRVHLAVHLLEQEIELAAAGLGAMGERPPVADVAPEARDFLADVRSCSAAHDLLRDGGLVGLQLRSQLAHALVQPGLHRRAP